MRPKLIAVKKVVDKNDRPIALIVVESTKSNAFVEADLKSALTTAATDCATLLMVWKDHLPTPSVAQDERTSAGLQRVLSMNQLRFQLRPEPLPVWQ